MKTFQQFQLESQQFDEKYKLAATQAYKFLKKTPIVKKIGRLPVVKKAKRAVKNFRTKPTESDYVRMYHGTTDKAADNILKKGMKGSSKNALGDGVYDSSAILKRRAFVTIDPDIARQYTMQHEYLGKKPSILGVKVLKKRLKKGNNPGEYTAPVRDIKPIVKDVKPIEIRKGRVMQEGKGDAIQAAKMLGKKVKQISPKLMAKTKEFLRNQRSGLNTSVRRSHKQLKAVEKTDKYSKLATDRKSIHPPTADAAQAKFVDRKVELIKSKNNRRREKERLLRRMFEKGDK